MSNVVQLRHTPINHVVKVVDECVFRCPYFNASMDGMECRHPYFAGKGYENMIITHANGGQGRIPPKCPLKESAVTTVIRLDARKL
jgi:hypothetical protein